MSVAATASAFFKSTTGNPTITNFTLMGWFLVTSFTNAQSFFSISTADGVSGYTLFSHAADGTLRVESDPNTDVADGTGALVANTWYWLALTVAGTGAGQALGYKNAVLVITQTGSGSPTNAWLGVGGFAPGTGSDSLRYQNIFVYNAVLTQLEIQRQMLQMQPVRYRDLLRWSHCYGDAPAQCAQDNSGQNNPWTIVGSPTASLLYAPVAWVPQPPQPPILEYGFLPPAGPSGTHVDWSYACGYYRSSS